MNNTITLSQYLISRLNELGIEHLFGVPGDYNLNFLDYVEDSQSLEWVGNCNELNAAYAADGYARVNGIGAVLTTSGVGELSALNGIAGSFAENVAVIHLVGMPASEIQRAGLPNHHTFGDGDFNKFIRTQVNVTCIQEVLQPSSAAKQIDRALTQCYLQQRPVVIGIAVDMFGLEIIDDKLPLNLILPSSAQILQEDTVKQVVAKLKSANQPLVIVDALCRNHNLISHAKQFINQTNIPFVTTLMSKGDINEEHPYFLGEYLGDSSYENVLYYVNQSDLIIWFGRRDSDINSGWFSSIHDFTKMLRIDSNQAAAFNNIMLNLNGAELTTALLTDLSDYKNTSIFNKMPVLAYIPSKDLTQESFWHYAHKLIKSDSTIVAELGSCAFGLFGKQLPKNVQVICQVLWASIGYSVGATLGVLLAKATSHTYLFVGDGSFQLTAQEISTMLRHKQTPIVFLINNNGYTVEKCIHGAGRQYNNIAQWDYCHFVKSFSGPLKTWKITTIKQMEELESELAMHEDKLRFIEVVLGETDVPEVMQRVFAKYSNLHKVLD